MNASRCLRRIAGFGFFVLAAPLFAQTGLVAPDGMGWSATPPMTPIPQASPHPAPPSYYTRSPTTYSSPTPIVGELPGGYGQPVPTPTPVLPAPSLAAPTLAPPTYSMPPETIITTPGVYESVPFGGVPVLEPPSNPTPKPLPPSTWTDVRPKSARTPQRYDVSVPRGRFRTPTAVTAWQARGLFRP